MIITPCMLYPDPPLGEQTGGRGNVAARRKWISVVEVGASLISMTKRFLASYLSSK